MSMARAANVSVAQWNTSAEKSDSKTKMEITTLVGGEMENMGIPHYFTSPKGRAARKKALSLPWSYHNDIIKKYKSVNKQV